MYEPYVSPLAKARKFLSNIGMEDEDEQFINQAKTQGYGEDTYLPAIASKKMRQQDAELEQNYQQYKQSPTTFMSNLKFKYGTEDRGGVMDTVGFVSNLFTDFGENVEEVGKILLNPVDTAKSLGYAIANPKQTGKAVLGALKDNFGTLEKAKETFYENPFDVLSIVIPAAKLGKVGTLAKTAGKATGLTEKIAPIAKVIGDTGFVGKHEELIKKLSDVSNWDINMAKGIGGGIGKAAGAGTDFASSLIYGPQGKDILKNVLQRTKSKAGRESIEQYKQMGDTGVIGEFEKGMQRAEKVARTDMDKAAVQTAELTPISGGKVGENFVKDGTLSAKYQKGGILETQYKVGDANKGEYINIGEKGIAQSPEALSAQTVINDTMKSMGMPPNWLDNFSPTKSQRVINKLEDLVKGRLETKVAGETQNLVGNYIKWMKKAQNESFPLIKRARQGMKDFYKFSEELASETSLSGKQSVIANRIASAGSKETMQSAIKYLQDKGGVNLTDMASALASKKLIGRGAGYVLGGGAVAAMSNPITFLGAIGYTALSSPAVIYSIARATGGMRNLKTLGVDKLGKIAKSLDVSVEELQTAIKNVSNAPDAKEYMELLKVLGKGTISRKSLGLLERINKNIQEQYAGMSEELKGQAQEMESAVSEGIQPPTTEQPMDIEVPEGLQINPNLLK